MQELAANRSNMSAYALRVCAVPSYIRIFIVRHLGSFGAENRKSRSGCGPDIKASRRDCSQNQRPDLVLGVRRRPPESVVLQISSSA